jgi:hypothetical protein
MIRLAALDCWLLTAAARQMRFSLKFELQQKRSFRPLSGNDRFVPIIDRSALDE